MRKFPNPHINTLKSYVVHTNLLERLPSNMSIVEKAIKEGKENGDPYATGQFSAINYILRNLLSNDDLLPNSKLLVSEQSSFEKTEWIRTLHSLQMTPIRLHLEKMLDPTAPLPHHIGSYRFFKKVLGTRMMPNPTSIKKHMHELLLSICSFNESIDQKIKNPFMLSKMDLQTISDICYETNLKICCIKPFEDGSNRIARLVENALRLYWGLPWKIIQIEDKDKYLSDIFEMQKKYPER